MPSSSVASSCYPAGKSPHCSTASSWYSPVRRHRGSLQIYQYMTNTYVLVWDLSLESSLLLGGWLDLVDPIDCLGPWVLLFEIQGVRLHSIFADGWVSIVKWTAYKIISLWSLVPQLVERLSSLVVLYLWALVVVLLWSTHVDQLLECLLRRIVAVILLGMVNRCVLKPFLADVCLNLGLPDELPVLWLIQYFLVERRSSSFGKTSFNEVLNIRSDCLLIINCILSHLLRMLLLLLLCRPSLLWAAWVGIWNTGVSGPDWTIVDQGVTLTFAVLSRNSSLTVWGRPLTGHFLRLSGLLLIYFASRIVCVTYWCHYCTSSFEGFHLLNWQTFWNKFRILVY